MKEQIYNPPEDEFTPGKPTKWTLHHSRLNLTINANDIFDIHSCCVYGDVKEFGTIDLPAVCLRITDEEYLEGMRKQGFTLTINKGVK